MVYIMNHEQKVNKMISFLESISTEENKRDIQLLKDIFLLDPNNFKQNCSKINLI